MAIYIENKELSLAASGKMHNLKKKTELFKTNIISDCGKIFSMLWVYNVITVSEGGW